MPTFCETRETLLHAHYDNVIDDKEFVFLFDLNTSNNRDIEYWKYLTFDLNSYGDDDVVAQFRFMKRDIHRLRDALDLPNKITRHFYNDLVVDSTEEALCIVLSRLAYPCRYVDMGPLLGRSVPQLSMIFTQIIDLMDSSHNHRLSDSVHRKGAALDNVLAFIDGTVRPCCRRKVNQRILNNGHKRLHALKYQSVTTPSGMIANLFGPVEGKRHDCAILYMSGLLQTLQRYSHGPNGEVLCIFGTMHFVESINFQTW